MNNVSQIPALLHVLSSYAVANTINFFVREHTDNIIQLRAAFDVSASLLYLSYHFDPECYVNYPI